MRKEQILFPVIRNITSRPKLAAMIFRFDRWGNPFTAEVDRDPYPMNEVIRADGPVVYRATYQQWFVTGYDECKQVLASDDVAVGEQIEMLLDIRPYNKLSDDARFLFRHFLLFKDPPDHTRLRRLVNKAFTPKRVGALEERIGEIADALLTGAREESCPDLVDSFNVRLPINVIADMLGIPEERWDWARETTSQLVKLLDPFEGFDPDDVNRASGEIFDYYGQLADERQANPADDLITALVEAEDDGDRLSRKELVVMAAFLMGAGFETTAGVLGNAMLALAKFPEQRTLVRDNPDLWPNAVDELVRYDTSVKRDPRFTLAEMTIGGVTIPAGSNILLMLDAANRDPRRYDRANELILDREDPRPISFGHGIHHCLGAALARLELRVGLQRFLEAFGDYEVDEEAVVWKRSASLRGPLLLPITPRP